MAAENRLYAKFTLDYADSHKIAPLSDAAFRAHVRMVLWSRRMLTDGKIPGAMARVFAKPRVLAELTSNDPEHPSLIRDGEDYWLHDFTEHQSTRAEVEARQSTNRANGARGGGAKAKRTASKSLSESEANVYTETETETETQTETTSTDVEVAPRKRGTRIADPFVVTREMREWAANRAPYVNVDLATEKFVNYWRARTRDATKLDWLATWHNWLLSDAEKNSTQQPKSKAQTRTENNLNVVAMFAAQEKGALEA